LRAIQTLSVPWRVVLLHPLQSALVQITVERPVCLEVYTDFRALGRVALREGGRTIALGLVTQVVSAA